MLDRVTYARLSRARDYLAAHYRNHVSLADAARVGCLSPFHFHRLFTMAFGETPHAFVSRQRIEEAKRRLLTGSETALQICHGVGFESPTTFSTRFRRVVGCGPREYRLTMRRLFPVAWEWYREAIPHCYIQMFGVSAKPQD